MSPHPRTLHAAYIALGSNLPSAAGDPSATLRVALDRLRALAEPAPQDGLEPAPEAGLSFGASSLYATDPVGYPSALDQPTFINAAARLSTSLGPEPLLEALLAIERDFGRVRDELNAPRTLDLDLLLLGDLVLSSNRLTLPHPRLHERRFVLAPLAEIAPMLRHPVLGRTMADLLAALPTGGEQAADRVRRL